MSRTPPEIVEGMKAALIGGKRVLCVSTQLIEAGVDIDFATVVRDLAGLDSIAQAAGRCNRNGDRRSGRVHIVKMADPLPKQLEEIRCAQQNARRVLEDWRDDKGDAPFPLSDPLQMERFFGHHFFARKGPDGLSSEGSARRHPATDAGREWHGGRGFNTGRRETSRIHAVIRQRGQGISHDRWPDSGVNRPVQRGGKEFDCAL